MAATIKYILPFKDDFNRDVAVVIITDNYLGQPIVLTGSENPCSVSYSGEDGDLFQTMIQSKATIRVFLPDDNIELAEDIATMDEDTFGVLITVRENGDLKFRWDGWLVPDEQQRNFSYYNQVVELTAIDALSRLKGQKLLADNGAYITGRHPMKYYINRCFEDVFTPYNSLGSFNLVVQSSIVLSRTTSTILPDVLEQLSISAQAFNDDMGRPTNAYEVVKTIAEALFMRCFYENGSIHFVDILDYKINNATLPIDVKYKEHPDFDPNADSMLLGNSENITTIRTFRESIGRFEYKGMVGMLIDGYLVNWTSVGGGYRLTDWYYNSYLESRADVLNRRVGTGRAEEPYGILLTWTNDGTTVPITGRKFDMISSRTSEPILPFDRITVTVKFKLLHPDNIPFIEVEGQEEKYVRLTQLFIFVVMYNDFIPNQSYVAVADGNGGVGWVQIDLSGTSFAVGNPDWSVFESVYISNLDANTSDDVFGMQFRGISKQATATFDIQELTFELGGIPPQCYGTMYVAIHPSIAPNVDRNPQMADTVVYSCIVAKDVQNITKETSSGEIVYVSRKLRTSEDNITREIKLNTTENTSVSGSISTSLTYFEGGSPVFPDNVPAIALKPGYPNIILEFKIPLLWYNAIAMMYLNYAQYKIDFEIRGKNNSFFDSMDLSALYDSARPSTSIYNEVFIQSASDYNLKKSEKKVTAISMRLDARNVATQYVEGDDFLESYYLK